MDSGWWKTAMQEQLRSVMAQRRGQLSSPRTLSVFYANRSYAPVWFDGSKPTRDANDILHLLKNADIDGLRPEDYHVDKLVRLGRLLKSAQTPEMVRLRVELDLFLTDGYLTFGADLAKGRIEPIRLHEAWAVKREKFSIRTVLEDALKEGGSPAKALEALSPTKPDYVKLREMLEGYEDVARQGGWPLLGRGAPLKLGERSARAEQLRRRLQTEIDGDLAPWKPGGTVFDKNLQTELMRFQARHGLPANGKLTKRTLAALNVPTSERINQIKVNLERLRWLPRSETKPYVFVDIANFRLTVYENEKSVLSMRIVVGQDEWETPVFSNQISYIVLNPSWIIPRSIVLKEILPHVQNDPEYLERQKIVISEIPKEKGEEPREVPSEEVDWLSLSETNFPYRFSKGPGPDNPLGSMKFMFPNRFSVYLHGTQDESLFSRQIRAFSHGCIRVEKPLELAEYLLKDDWLPWTAEDLVRAIANGEEKEIRLPEPIKIHLFYRTAWAGDDGFVHFRQDVYGWDRPLLQALQGLPVQWPLPKALDTPQS